MRQPGTGHQHVHRAAAVNALRAWIDANGGQQKALAKAADVSEAFISMVLNTPGYPIPDSVLAVIGWHAVVTYRQKAAA
jgi:hypothetical protein